jgi:hypothetical protein
MVGSRPDLRDNISSINFHVHLLGIINGWALVLRNQSDEDRHYVVEHGRVIDMIPNGAFEANREKLKTYPGV